MNRKQRTILLLVVFWAVVIGVPGAWLWRADRQERLNRQLFDALLQNDVPSLRLALERGADVNALYGLSKSMWQKFWDLVRVQHSPQSGSMPTWTPICFAVQLGEPDAVRLLLRYHANPNAQINFVVIRNVVGPDDLDKDDLPARPHSVSLLRSAEFDRSPEIAQLLRAAGARR